MFASLFEKKESCFEFALDANLQYLQMKDRGANNTPYLNPFQAIGLF